ncbi:Hsp20/alpha crystallin family protein [Heyndrickxia acidiproducens]|uniref:Hsp20/alpha crystallin family protein n=1 Tax=Heyndrickxia acidiproducens TaxID=1121084 RepID=UPI00036E1B23|nr:Hsp20/alpha crystallin family protein [Heyndrickxia acidiproducens]
MFPWNTFPFNQDVSEFMKNMQLPNMDEQMSQAFSQWMPEQWKEMFGQNGESGAQGPASDTGQAEADPVIIDVFETLDFIYVRVRVQQKEWLEQLKIFHTSHKAILKHIPAEGDEQEIQLPSPVLRKGTTARYQDGILEVRFVKKAENQMTEIDIRFS